MKLSTRIQTVAPSATLAITARAKAMRADGIDVLPMSAGEPDFDPPDAVKTAAQKAVQDGVTRYTPVPGTPALRQAVAQRTAETYGREFAPAQVIVGAGGKQVLFNACAALLDPGDEVVIIAPYWVSYPDMVRFAGAEPVYVQTDVENGFVPSVGAIGDAITKRTRLIILNSPSNPTGAVYPKETLEGIANLLRDWPDVFILTDDIYEGLVFDGPFMSIAHVAPDLSERLLVASGVSKTYAMTGWRIGYGIGPNELISAMSRLQGASTSGASCIAQEAALAAITGDQSTARQMKEAFFERRQRIVTGLREIPDLQIFEPGGAFYVFPRIKSYLRGDLETPTALCEYLLTEKQVALVPGEAFGSDSHLRISFACANQQIDTAIERIREGLAAL